ncbi:replication initiation factor domain-containing protein [Paenibacillus alvei]|uniref:replication initiation factor domain-containing protein n=1 Tax=Paenibacillus alvei TaxID=44250 RepID=UPI00227FDF4A|nr:replication initiation factor domain-containing protein [Paenibacillus alvei]MCY7487912.1 replication initiation factor domain-containing protein [Paenibacillus alvei]
MQTVGEQPPYSNTGALSTYRGGLRACVDWAEWTFKKFYSVYEVFEILGIESDAFVQMEYSRNPKYSVGYYCKDADIEVYADGKKEGMGIHIVIKGTGCRQYENLDLLTWLELFELILLCEGSFSRLDLAIDDICYTGQRPYFMLSTLRKKQKAGEISSIMKMTDFRESHRVGDGSSKGKTVYIGSEKSNVRIRFYEKHHQLKNKGYELSEEIEVWNRTEIQLRDENAQSTAFHIVNNNGEVGSVTLGLLKRYCRFCIKGTDSNKSRWKTAPFWDKFLGDVEPLYLAKVEQEMTIERRKRWFDTQTPRTMAALFSTYGWEYIVDLIEQGKDKLTDLDIEQIEKMKAQIEAKKKKEEYEKNYEYGCQQIRLHSMLEYRREEIKKIIQNRDKKNDSTSND